MKVVAVAILLVSLYCIEAAVVKREAESEPEAPTIPPNIQQFFSQYLPNLSEYFKKDYTAQARAFMQQVNERLFNEELREQVSQTFNRVLESVKKGLHQ